MRRITIAAALLLAGAADAQTLYTCVSSNGTSYQQQPCPRTARLIRSIETVPEPPPTAVQLAERAQKAQRDREESAFLSHLAGTEQLRSYRSSGYRSSGYRSSGYRSSGYRSSGRALARRDSPSDDCRAAKANRQSTLRATGLARNFDLLRKLDDDVSEACMRH